MDRARISKTYPDMLTGSGGGRKNSKSSSAYIASLKSDWKKQDPVSKNIKKEKNHKRRKVIGG